MLPGTWIFEYRTRVPGLARPRRRARVPAAGAVTLVTIADGRDDIGTTVSAFCPVSGRPAAGAGLPDRRARTRLSCSAGLDRFAVTVLAAAQRALAGRFAAAGRPGARLLLDGVPHQRGAVSGALIPDGGLAALSAR